MMDAYSSVGMPINYPHWSFGKKFIETERLYKHGQQGLAYEIVINSNPCIAYLMEENTITMQALVMAHACYGHNSFFQKQLSFRSWTDASSIVDYLIFARNYITDCEERYGVDEVRTTAGLLPRADELRRGPYKRPQKISLQEEKARQKSREEYLQSQVNMLWRTLPKREEEKTVAEARRYPSEPQENLLYFMEKNAPLLEPWQREILRIVRKVSQYFYPQSKPR
ncbi:SpoVR family protein [Enterobacter hormaechei]